MIPQNIPLEAYEASAVLLSIWVVCGVLALVLRHRESSLPDIEDVDPVQAHAGFRISWVYFAIIAFAALVLSVTRLPQVTGAYRAGGEVRAIDPEPQSR